MERTDLAIIGGGAAGLAAGIFAGEANRAAGGALRIVVFEGARKPGAKILISGGGRCNVTNKRVRAEDFNGGPRPIIRNVLRAFDEQRALEWLRSLGVPLKLEPTGKYFPVSDRASTVLDALLRRLSEVGAELLSGSRVAAIEQADDGFRLRLGDQAEVWRARRVIIATGGLALPKSGSDGAGIEWLRGLGHTIVPLTPALAPLVLRAGGGPGGRFAELSGLTLEMRIALHHPSGRRVAEETGSLLFTHFGLSGPAPMNFSRHLLRARLEQPEVDWRVTLGHPELPHVEAADAWLRARGAKMPRATAGVVLARLFPERLAWMLGEDIREPMSQLTRARRLELAGRMARLPVEVIGDRGYSFAETSAGGVDLREIDPRTMASRCTPGLHLCGELLDCDGRIGGFNFQWAWATGYLAGRGAAGDLLRSY